MKLRVLSILLALVLLLGLVPSGALAAMPAGPSAAAYARADAIFDAVFAAAELETRALSTPAQRVYNTLLTLDGVVPESVSCQGNARVVWDTEDGIGCAWSKTMAQRMADAQPGENDLPLSFTEDYSTAAVHGRDTYLVQPYYGIDNSFTTQYLNEAKRVAKAAGGTCTYAQGSQATIDFVAEAIAKGGVIIFDSHGETDFEEDIYNEYGEYLYTDCTSQANTSYLCLQTGSGLTEKDYTPDKNGVRHAVYMGYSIENGKRMYIYTVDGTAIANHMTGPANNGLLWSAICLGMATDGIAGPLMAKGLGAAYGYSQSVTFAGDYDFEGTFFQSLCADKTVAQSIADMKERWGCWDWSPQIAEAYGHGYHYEDGAQTFEEAIESQCAFPIVVSAEDAYPGRGNVDALQNVKSTWVLKPECPHSFGPWEVRVEPTLTETGLEARVCTLCGHEETRKIAELGCHAVQFTDVPLGAWYHKAVDFVAERGIMQGTSATTFGPTAVMTRAEVATLLWKLENRPEPEGENPFSDVSQGHWGRKAIVWAAEQGIVSGVGGGRFDPAGKITREQMVTMLWRYSGKPEGDRAVLSAFSDNGSVSSFAKDAMAWAVEQGYIQGSGSGLNPLGKMSRAEVATFMMRYLGE